MKKMMLTLCAVLCISGCGCSSGMEEGRNGVNVHIKNNTDFKLYGVEINTSNASHTVVNADGSEVEKDEVLIIELLSSDISASESFELFVLTEDDGYTRIPVKHFYDIAFNPGQSWYFELEGEDENSLALYKER